MNKKLTILLTIFMASVLSLTGCKKEAKKVEGDAKKLVANVKDGAKTVKTGIKNVKAGTKVAVNNVANKIAGINFAAKLDLNAFPEEAVMIGSIDVQKFLKIEMLKPLFTNAMKEAKEKGIDLEKATFASWYMNAEDLNAEKPELAGIVNNFIIPESLLIAEKIKVNKESYNGVEILLDDKKEGGYVTLGTDTLGGSLVALKKMIDVKKGKLKSLAKSPSGALLSDILSKTGDSALRVAVITNKSLSEQLKKAAKEGQGAMIAEFLNNFKAASFGIGTTKDAFTFTINFRSNKAGIDTVTALIKPYVGMIQQDNAPMLQMAEPMLGKEGVKMLSAVAKTVKVNNNGEYLSITFETKYEYWLKAPEILGGLMGSMQK